MEKFFLFFIVVCITYSINVQAQNSQPPVTKKISKTFSEHGYERTDDYFWLNNPSDSNVINHLKEENAYVESYLKHTEALQKKLYEELVARIPGQG